MDKQTSSSEGRLRNLDAFTSAMSSGNHGQGLQIQDPSLTSQNTSGQTEETPIDQTNQNGHGNVSHSVNAVTTLRETAAQMCGFVQMEPEEASCDSTRGKATTESPTNQMQLNKRDSTVRGKTQNGCQKNGTDDSLQISPVLPASRHVKEEPEMTAAVNNNSPQVSKAFTPEQNPGDGSELVATIATGKIIVRKPKKQRRINQENVQTSSFIKTEDEEMSFDPVSEGVHQIDSHLVKKKEKPSAFLFQNGQRRVSNNCVQNEMDETLTMDLESTPEQNGDYLLPPTNQSFNQLVQENTINFAQDVNQEQKEKSRETTTQDLDLNPQIEAENVPQTSRSVHEDNDEMSIDPISGNIPQINSNWVREETPLPFSTRNRIQSSQIGGSLIYRYMYDDSLQLDYDDEDGNDSDDSLLSQTSQSSNPLFPFAQETTVNFACPVNQQHRKKTVETETQDGGRDNLQETLQIEAESVRDSLQNEMDDSLLAQMSQGLNPLYPFDLQSIVNYTPLMEREHREMFMETETRDTDRSKLRETLLIAPENEAQTSQSVNAEAGKPSTEHATPVLKGMPPDLLNFDDLHQACSELVDTIKQLFSAGCHVHENEQPEAEEGGVHQTNGQVSVKEEEDEVPVPLLPENASSSFVKQEPHDSSTQRSRIVKDETTVSLQIIHDLKEESNSEGDNNDIPRQTFPNQIPEATGQSHQRDDSFSVARHKTFNSTELKHNLRFSGDTADFGAFYSNIVNTLKEKTKKSLIYAKPGDKIQIELRNVTLKTNVSVILSNKNDLSGLRTLLDRLGEASDNINQLEMVVQIIHAPVGGVKRKFDDFEDRKQHLHIPRNHNGPLSFAISVVHCLHPDIDDSQAAILGAEMQRRVGLANQAVTFTDVSKFELLLNRNIVVFYNRVHATEMDIFQTYTSASDLPVYLYKDGNSCYFGIRNVTAFLGCIYICEYCFQTLDSIDNHRCHRLCRICRDISCVNTDEEITCKDCNQKCRSRHCYVAHKRALGWPQNLLHTTQCDTKKRCKKCSYVYSVPVVGNFHDFQHNCLMKHCLTCGGNLNDNETHKCYILPLASVHNQSKSKLVFYEFKTYKDASGKKIPFVLSVKTQQGITWTVYGERCIVKFLCQLKSKPFCGTTFVSHHTDSSLLLDSMIEIGLAPNVVTQNGKIVCVELPDLKQKFVDAAVFLPMPLAALPAMFGLDTYRGFFPVGFISKANLGYVGPCPAPEFYAVEKMSKKRRQEFEAHHRASISEFNFKREAQKYCDEDVNILMTACVKLQMFFINGYSVDLFSCATLQSLGMNVFRTKFLPMNTLALPQFDLYKPNKSAISDSSIEWLEWIMFSEKIFIHHKLNKGPGRSTKLLSVVDGYSMVEGEKGFWKFLHCQQNGCSLCFPNIDHGERHRRCKQKLAKLKRYSDMANVKVVVLREHTWNEMKRSNRVIREFLQRFNSPQPPRPDDLPYGCMSGVLKLQHSAAADEEILFVEVDSLFPYAMKNKPYPVGHPRLIRDSLLSTCGLIKAVVSPPRHLLFPLLPYKTTDGKTVFTLCRTCADSNQQGPCNHTAKERELTGVWVTPEINKAVQMGYYIRRIIEVWHFDTVSNNIFNHFVSNFENGKQGSLNRPSNPVKMHIYKNSLDEFWKGFGDGSPSLQNKIVTNNADLMKLMFSTERKVESFKILSEKTALVQSTPNQNAKSVRNKTDNIFVTAFTAAYARLHLSSILEKLKDKVLYYDTDRIVYVSKVGQNELEFGRAPGQPRDKLRGDVIREFASVGPKTYAYQTKTKRVVLNVKGITRTLENPEDVNFSVTDVVKPNGHEGETVYDQRRLLPNGNTVPFGFNMD